MKRYGNLYSQIVDINNIYKAIECASREKKKRRNVIKVLDDIDNYAKQLQEMLINKAFKPSPYNVEKILDSARKKERIIKKPRFFPDQCVHWALMLVIEPILYKRMYQWSCSSIPNRGTFYAKDYVVGALKDYKNTKYVYQLDIKKFYPSIDNEILKTKLRKVFKDNDVLWLLDEIIDSDKGLPIGNYTSQWLANFYLNDLDMFIKHKLGVPYYIRYADDILVFHSNKRKLRKCRLEIEKFIEKEHLAIKPNWQIYPTSKRPIDFLGFKFFEGKITLRDSNYLRIKRRAKKIGKKENLNIKDARSMTSYWGYITHTNSHKFYFNDIRPYCDIEKCKEIISYESKKYVQTKTQL